MMGLTRASPIGLTGAIKTVLPALAALTALTLTSVGCRREPHREDSASTTQPSTNLTARQQAMLKRVTQLLHESGHWDDRYPLHSIAFDEARRQWMFLFSDLKPDSGLAAFISDENAEQIDILLFPPMWTRYERKTPSNQMISRIGAIDFDARTNRARSSAGNPR